MPQTTLVDVKGIIDEHLPRYLDGSETLETLVLVGMEIAHLGKDLGNAVQYLMESIHTAFTGEEGLITRAEQTDPSNYEIVQQMYTAFLRIEPLMKALRPIEIRKGRTLQKSIDLQYNRRITFVDGLLLVALKGFLQEYVLNSQPEALEYSLAVAERIRRQHASSFSVLEETLQSIFPENTLRNHDQLVFFLLMNDPVTYSHQINIALRGETTPENLQSLLALATEGFMSYLTGKQGLIARAGEVLEQREVDVHSEPYRQLLHELEGIRSILTTVREREQNALGAKKYEDYVPVSDRIGIETILKYGETYVSTIAPLFIALATPQEIPLKESEGKIQDDARRMLSYGVAQLINPYVADAHVVVAAYLGIALEGNLTPQNFQGYHGRWLKALEGPRKGLWKDATPLDIGTRKVPTGAKRLSTNPRFISYCQANAEGILQEYGLPSFLSCLIISETINFLDTQFERHQARSSR